MPNFRPMEYAAQRVEAAVPQGFLPLLLFGCWLFINLFLFLLRIFGQARR